MIETFIQKKLCACGCGKNIRANEKNGHTRNYARGHCPHPSIVERFWSNVKKTDNCWHWTGSVGSHGYGQIYSNRGIELAHRLSWKLAYESIPRGLHCLHKCDTRNCVRPDHLFLGTNVDNITDKVTKGRQIKGEKVPSSKLTVKKVCEMKKIYLDQKVAFQELGSKFGVSRRTASRIIKGEFWKHV